MSKGDYESKSRLNSMYLKLTPDIPLYKRLRLMTLLLQSRDMGTIYRPKKEKLKPYLQVHHSCSLQTLSDVLAWQDDYKISLGLWTDLFTIYRPDTKWIPDLVSQILHSVLTADIIGWNGKTKRRKWRHCNHYVTWLKFVYQIQNKDKTWYLKF